MDSRRYNLFNTGQRCFRGGVSGESKKWAVHARHATFPFDDSISKKMKRSSKVSNEINEGAAFNDTRERSFIRSNGDNPVTRRINVIFARVRTT